MQPVLSGWMLQRLTLALPTRVTWLVLAGAVISGAPAVLQAQQPTASPPNQISSDASRATLHAIRVTEAPVIDGRLTDEVWLHAPVADHFRQHDPNEGEPATERTEIRVLYDEGALYVGARLYDREPSGISTRATITARACSSPSRRPVCRETA